MSAYITVPCRGCGGKAQIATSGNGNTVERCWSCGLETHVPRRAPTAVELAPKRTRKPWSPEMRARRSEAQLARFALLRSAR